LRAALALLLALSASCKGDGDREPARSAAEEKHEETPAADKPAADKPGDESPGDAPEKAGPEYMHRHFDRLHAARDTLIFGDLKTTVESLQWLAEHGAEGPFPDAWQPFTRRFHAIAQRAVETPSAKNLGMRIAELSKECGACHTSNDVEPRLPSVEAAPSGPAFKLHMRGHKWAVDRLWAGLVIPSEKYWKEGIEHLKNAPPHLKNLSEYGDELKDAIKYANSVHLEAQSDDRVTTFGRVLAACAGCHELTRKHQGKVPGAE
jgi:mono/diheme cytochrome c family protein